MKRKILIALACWVCTNILAQFNGPQWINPTNQYLNQSLLSTGGDGTQSTWRTPGLTDIRWQVLDPTFGAAWPYAVVVTPPSGAGWVSPSGGPISGGGVAPYTTWISPPNHSNTGPKDYFYKIVFNLPVYSTPGPPAFFVEWLIFADDQVKDIWVNSQAAVVNNSYGNWNLGLPFKWCKFWKQGQNEIMIKVRSTRPTTGLYVISTTHGHIQMIGPSSVCPGTTSTFTVSQGFPMQGVVNTLWTKPAGWSGPSITTANPFPWTTANLTSSANSGLVQAAFYDANGQCQGVSQLTVNVLPKPVVNITAPAICPGALLNMSATGGVSYQWGLQSPTNSVPIPPLQVNLQNISIFPGPTVPTTYTVKVTGANGCTNVGSTTIGMLPLPNISVAAQPPVICSGQPNTLTFSGAQTYKVLPNTLPSPNPYTLPAPVAPGQYVVVGTAANGCTNTAAVTLAPGPTVTPIVSDMTLCLNAATCTNITASSLYAGGPVTYYWEPLPAPQPGTFGQSINICPTSNTIYQVTASAPNACPSSTTMQVDVDMNCCPQPTTGCSLMPGIVSGPQMNTSFIVNQNITLGPGSTQFINSELLIMPGMQITVPAGSTLELDHSHLFACGINMWQGIVVQDGGNVITANAQKNGSSLIEDAVVAIDVDAISPNYVNPPIDVEMLIFNRNHTGIKLSNSDPNISSLPIGVKQCVFSSRDIPFASLVPLTLNSWPNSDVSSIGLRYSPPGATAGLASPFTLQGHPQTLLKLPYNTQPGHIGIDINNIGNVTGTLPAPGSGVDIGVTYQSGRNQFNLFDGLGIGIRARDASLVTMANVFQNMKRYNVNNAPFGGFGIRHEMTGLMNSLLDLRPVGIQSTINGNRFWNCWNGVSTSNVYDVNIDYCTFRSTRAFNTGFGPGSVGVILGSNRFRYNVKNCQFNNIQFALTMNALNGSFDMGSGVSNSATHAEDIIVDENYFGPEVSSLNPIGTEYSDFPITFDGANAANWQIQGVCKIRSNRIDRSFHGIKTNKTDIYPIEIGGNNIGLIDDNVVNFVPEQYGIYCKDSRDNLFINQNVVSGGGYISPGTPAVWNTDMKLIKSVNNISTSGGDSPLITCNNVMKGYVGFEFEGAQTNTEWWGNTMYQPMSRGLHLMNNANIGVQGLQTQACADRWLDVGPDVWTSNFQTYVSNFAPGCTNGTFMGTNGTFLWVENPLMSVAYPQTNGTTGGAALAAGCNFMSVGLLDGADCLYYTNYSQPPSFRSANSATVNVNESDMKESMEHFVFYPNPTEGVLHVGNNHDEKPFEVRIFDIAGKMVYSKTISQGNNALDISGLAPAIYIVEVETDEHVVFHSKIAKN